MDFSKMTAAELAGVFNAKCPKDKRIKEWRASKAALISRIEALEASKTRNRQRTRAEKAKDERRGAIGKSVATLLRDARLSYSDILQLVMAAHPNASTSTRSIASVAAAMRRDGVDVPLRRSVGVSSDDRVLGMGRGGEDRGEIPPSRS